MRRDAHDRARRTGRGGAEAMELWRQAEAEHPDDPAAARLRYIELTKAAGIVITTKNDPEPKP